MVTCGHAEVGPGPGLPGGQLAGPRYKDASLARLGLPASRAATAMAALPHGNATKLDNKDRDQSHTPLITQLDTIF